MLVALALGWSPDAERGRRRRRPAARAARHRRVQRVRAAAGGHAARRGDPGGGQPDLRGAARHRRRGLPAHQVPGAAPARCSSCCPPGRCPPACATCWRTRPPSRSRTSLTLAVWAVARHRARRPLLPVGVSDQVLPAGLVLAGAVSVQCGRGDRRPAVQRAAARGGDHPAAVVRRADHARRRPAGAPPARSPASPPGGRGRTLSSRLRSGIALGFMNFAIYQAFARIPLGIAVTIEFLGPLSVTVAVTLRRPASPLRDERHRRAAWPRLRGAGRRRRAAARGHGSAGT